MFRKSSTASAVIGVFAITLVAVTSSADIEPYCFGSKATIRIAIPPGESFVTLNGTAHDDVIVIIGSNAEVTVKGSAGDDKICVNVPGGSGTISGNKGNDRMKAVTGFFTLDGGRGRDTAKGDGCIAAFRVNRNLCP